MSIEYRIGDVFDRLAEIPDGSIDLIVTSPPFAGSGTTLDAAQAVGRHAIGIDLDERNADLAQARVGMFLEVEGAA